MNAGEPHVARKQSKRSRASDDPTNHTAWIGLELRTVDGDLATGNRRDQPPAGFAGWRQILARGGSAADAAIAANAALGVLEPMMNGIGGDFFAIYWDAKTQTLSGLNASGPAPRRLNQDFLEARGIRSMSEAGVHAVTVPGAVAGWAQLHQRFGRTEWRQLFEAGIAYGERGFPVSEAIAEQWRAPSSVTTLKTCPESLRVFLPGHHPPGEGDLFRNPDLARAYRILAEEGPRSFYEGQIAAAVLRVIRDFGGLMNEEDLSGFTPEWVEPICVD